MILNDFYSFEVIWIDLDYFVALLISIDFKLSEYNWLEETRLD